MNKLAERIRAVDADAIGGLSGQMVAEARVCPAAGLRTVALKLDHHCVEAVRRACLCASLGSGAVLLAPRLRFGFRSPVIVGV